MTSARWPDAALLGFATSMRSFTPAAVLAARGRLTGRARGAALTVGLGELIYDKTPLAAPRTELPSLGGRILGGSAAGAAVAGPAGAVAGGATAAASTFATYELRKGLGKSTGLADPVIGVAEDVLAVSAAVLATRPSAEADSQVEPEPVLRSAARGLAAGLAGTVAMTIAQSAYHQLTAAEPSDAPLKVAQKAVKVPRAHRPAVNTGMHFLYGTTWGIPFGLLAGTRGAAPEPAGVALGLTVWGASLAQLPALGLAPPPWKQSPVALIADATFHVVYGLGAAGMLRALAPSRRTR